MKNLNHLNKYRIKHPIANEWGDEHNAAFSITSPISGKEMHILASNGGGWDHVSVSMRNRCPNWPEMCWVKKQFFEDDEIVIQYHPAKKDYVNCHPNCLHLWKPQNQSIPTPPSIFVGPKEHLGDSSE